MKTIEEGNILIAEFLGCYKYPENSFDNVWSYEIYGHLDFVDDGEYEKHYYLPSEMKFHSSWDWLMPVVEKIEGLGYDTEIVYRPDDGGHCFYINDSPIFSSQMGGKKEATYTVVVDFIEWYNENQQS